jgi:predicted RNA polymerase sigma factor
MLRHVMMLRDLQELPMTEVAEQLGITIPAAKSRLLRARLELKSRLSPYYKPDSVQLSRSAAPLERVAHHSALRLR